MNSWSDLPQAILRGTLGTPKRALITFGLMMGIFFLFYPPAFQAVWKSVIAPVLALGIIVLIGYAFFVKPLLPKKKSSK